MVCLQGSAEQVQPEKVGTGYNVSSEQRRFGRVLHHWGFAEWSESRECSRYLLNDRGLGFAEWSESTECSRYLLNDRGLGFQG